LPNGSPIASVIWFSSKAYFISASGDFGN